MATALAGVELLARSKAGLLPKWVHQLVEAVVMPRLLWGSAVWCDLKRRVRKSLLAVQPAAARLVYGGYRTTLLNSLKVEANLPPPDLALRCQLHRFALCLHSSMPQHPCHGPFQHACTSPSRRHHPSTFHCALHSFLTTLPPFTVVELLLPHALPRWDAPPCFKTVIARRKEEASTWDHFNELAVSSIVISCHSSVIHHIADCEHDAHVYWTALAAAFRRTDAQGSLRLLTRFWSLSLPTASAEAFDTFLKEYKATLASLKAAKVDLKVIYSSHLLSALPPSLNSLQTTLAVTNQGGLPKTELFSRPSATRSSTPRPPPTASPSLPPPLARRLPLAPPARLITGCAPALARLSSGRPI
ncbi:hypothetical protein JCM11251_003432 [Rhodosporidiobolus azoricus]